MAAALRVVATNNMWKPAVKAVKLHTAVDAAQKAVLLKAVAANQAAANQGAEPAIEFESGEATDIEEVVAETEE